MLILLSHTGAPHGHTHGVSGGEHGHAHAHTTKSKWKKLNSDAVTNQEEEGDVVDFHQPLKDETISQPVDDVVNIDGEEEQLNVKTSSNGEMST